MSNYDSTKFYWLQLKEDFFDEDAIDWLEEQPNGKEYSLFYLKLCLKSLRTNGILVRKVGTMLVPYDHIKLGELTKTSPDTVLIAMNLLMKIGLVEKLENGELYLTQVSDLIGSQSKSAFKKQQQLAKKSLNLITNDDRVEKIPPQGGKNSTPIVEKIPPKIDIELELDKEIKIDKKQEKKQKLEQMFEVFWGLYPKKIDKKHCLTAFCNIKGLEKEFESIIKALKEDRSSEQWQRDNGKFIPYPLTWLHQERWKSTFEAPNGLPYYMRDESRPEHKEDDEETKMLAIQLFNEKR